MSTTIWYEGTFSNVKKHELAGLTKFIEEEFGNEEAGVVCRYEDETEEVHLWTACKYRYSSFDDYFSTCDLHNFCNEHGIEYELELLCYDPVHIETFKNEIDKPINKYAHLQQNIIWKR